jgi:hypothetical protein
MTAPHLPKRLMQQLARVPVSHDRFMHYAPCLVRLRSGRVCPRVYVAEESEYLALWGYDPSRPAISIRHVGAIEDSPLRLGPTLADRVYEAGESGMGYTIFTVHMKDGRSLPFSTGGAVDFPNWPPGVDPKDAVSVEPHVGREHFQASGSAKSLDYLWCLYSV